MSDGNRTDHIAAETNINVGSMVFVDAKEVLSSAIEGLQAKILKHKVLTEPQNPQANCVAALQARVAELEEALRQLEADCDADYPPSTGAIKYAIRAALGGKDE